MNTLDVSVASSFSDLDEVSGASTASETVIGTETRVLGLNVEAELPDLFAGK